ncbi:MAG: hypothetical protein ACOX0V_06925 [Bacteroidales bacterium]
MILITVFLQIHTYAQDEYFYYYDEYKNSNDSLPVFGITKVDNIFVLGIKEFDSLVFVTPDISNIENYMNIKFMHLITDKRNIYAYFDTPYFENFNYHIFDSSYYLAITNNISPIVWDFILPNISDEYASILKKTYPKKYFLYNIEIRDKEEYGCHFIRQICHKKFLCLLMNVSFYNKIREKISPHNYLFKGSGFEKGLFIKVLIPLNDDINAE